MYNNASFKEKIITALSDSALDYLEQLDFIQGKYQAGENWRPASILLIIESRPDSAKTGSRGCYFLLNKRSLHVQQPGDLCCPGGGSNFWLDHILSYLLSLGLFKPSRGKGFQAARKRGFETLGKISFFLTTALRESWEEIRLNPFLLDFLGPLPCYQLTSFHRIIFPFVAMLEKEWVFKPNWEVEKIVRLPLETFFNNNNYALYSLKVPENLHRTIDNDTWEFPCFIPESEDHKEVLWGATYHIIMSLLRIVFGFKAPQPDQMPSVNGVLSPDYFLCPGPSGF